MTLASPPSLEMQKMNIKVITFTENGFKLGKNLKIGLELKGNSTQLSYKTPLKDWCEDGFKNADALVFIGATGIAVRGIAPLIKSKLTDPAVVVVDEKANFAISLLSGHIGGANQLANIIADITGATAVITTATDCNGLIAFDSWAAERGFFIENPKEIKTVSSKLLRGETLRIKSDFEIVGELPTQVQLVEENFDLLVSYKAVECDGLKIIPPVFTLGIGCRKGIEKSAIEALFQQVLKENSIHPKAIKQVASIDLKAEEAGLLEFCEEHSLKFSTFTADELGKLKGVFSSSDFVKSITGVESVCERSAVAVENGEIFLKKTVLNGVTMALAKKEISLNFKKEL